MNTKFDTIIFDLGGVLVDWDPRYVYDQIFEDPKELEFFLAEVCNSAWNAEQDRGRSFKDATELLLKEHPKYSAEITAYSERWSDMLKGEISESVSILKKIKESGRHRLLALTNWSHETWPVALETFDFLSWFEGIVVSGQVGMIKPNTDIYQHLLELYEVDPSKAIFIDDKEENVIAAEGLGLKGIWYKNPGSLSSILD